MDKQTAALPVTVYDEVPYPGRARPQTHPDRLATLATLVGMQPAPVESCRVLELACGDGANLIPVALGLPHSRCTGIDLAPSGIAKAEAIAQALGLKNITFHCLDLMEVSSALGTFDYIVAHGLYSWVGPAVRDKILEICKTCLAPQGVAFVSYNAFPGGHVRNMVREMMLFHIRDLTDPLDRIAQARALAKFVGESQCGENVYEGLLKRQLEEVVRRSDGGLFHDDLEETNQSVYFFQFIEHARQHGLQYVGDGDVFNVPDNAYPPHVAEKMRMFGRDILAKEQYQDFLMCRMFRQTVLCREGVPLEYNVKPERVRLFHLASSVRSVSETPEIRSQSAEKFRASKGPSLETNHPLIKAAMLELGDAWPQSMRFDEMLRRACARLAAGAENGAKADPATPTIPATSTTPTHEDLALLENTLMRAYEGGVVELHAHAPHFVLDVGERPMASALARLQAASGDLITNLRHSHVEIEDVPGRHLVSLLDGTRDRAALLEEINRFAEANAASAAAGDSANGNSNESKILAGALEENLAKTARLALLVA